MKASELRIGNLVYWDMNDPREENEPEQGYVEIKVRPKDIENPERILPIPLTEEWLVKFGFKQDGKSYLNGLLLIEKDLHEFNVWVNANFTKTILYVHSLQNLYFALTGEELEIK